MNTQFRDKGDFCEAKFSIITYEQFHTRNSNNEFDI